MKNILLSFALSFLTLSGFSQTINSDEGVLTLNIGAAIPMGDFALEEITNEKSGLAITGINMSIDYVYFLKGWLGIGLSGGRRINGIDEDAMINFMEENGATNSQIESKGWRTNYVAPVLVLKKDLSAQTSLYNKNTLGIAYHKSAEYSVTSQFAGARQPSAESNSVIGGLAIGFRHQPGKIGIGLELGALFTKPEFTIVNPSNKDRITGKQQMHTLNATFTVSHAIR